MPWLTRREQTLLAAVLLAFLSGLGIKQWRQTRLPAEAENSGVSQP